MRPFARHHYSAVNILMLHCLKATYSSQSVPNRFVWCCSALRASIFVHHFERKPRLYY